jgi:hypothetical protein
MRLGGRLSISHWMRGGRDGVEVVDMELLGWTLTSVTEAAIVT